MTDAQKPRTREALIQSIHDLKDGFEIVDDLTGVQTPEALYDEIRASVLSELAAQEPVAWVNPDDVLPDTYTGFGRTDEDTFRIVEHRAARSATYTQPLYVQPMPPVDQTAEVERLRGFIQHIFDDADKAVALWDIYNGTNTQAWARAVESKRNQWMSEYAALNAPQPETREDGK